MALGDITEITNEAAKLAGSTKAKKTPVEKELDNFGKQILDTEAKWRIASLSTLKGLNRFVTAVNKAAETVEKLKGLRAEGISGPSMDKGLQGRYASLQSRRRMAEAAIASDKLEKQLQQIRQKGLEDQIRDAKRASQLSAKKAIAYGPSYLASQKTTAGPATAESFIMQRKGRAVPIAADYTSSRVSGIRQPGTNVVPVGGSRALVPEYVGRDLVPSYSGSLPQTGGVPITGHPVGGGYMGMPNYGVPRVGGAYASTSTYGGGWGGIPAGLGAAFGGVGESALALAKGAYNYTSKAFEEPALEDIYRASRTGGGWKNYMAGVGAAPGGYNVSENLAHMGYTPESAAGVQNIYGSPFRSRTVMGAIGGLSTDVGATGTGNITKEQWASVFSEALKVGGLGGSTGMEQFTDAISKGFIKASKYALPAPAVLENIETYTKMMAGSSAVRTGGEMARAAGNAAQYALPNWRNLSVQTEALQSYDKLLGNMETNPMALLLGAGKMAGITGGKLTANPTQLAKFGGLGKGFKFSKVQLEAIHDAMKMGGMPGYLEEMDVLKMAGAKPEIIQKNTIDQLMKTGMPRARAEFLAGRILGTKYPEERWARRAAATTHGGALPKGMTTAMEGRAASKYDFFNAVPGDFGAAGELAVRMSEAPDVFGARRGRAATSAETIAKETAAISAFGPATITFKDAVGDFATAVKSFTDSLGAPPGAAAGTWATPPPGATLSHPAGPMGPSPYLATHPGSSEAAIRRFFGTPSSSTPTPTP